MSALRNVLVAGAVVAGGLIAYRYARNRYFSGEIPQDYAPPKPEARKPGSVSADQLVTVRTGNPITKREKGMQYFPILSTRSVGGTIERTFRPTIDGYYTGRILNQSKKLYAEVQPVASSLSGMSGIVDDIITPSANAIETLQSLLTASRGMKSGGGNRRAMARQISAAKRAVRKTPEYAAFNAQCKARLLELNFENDLQNKKEIYWHMAPDILTGNCRFHTLDYSSNSGGGGT